eukprot:TRINITY_DN8691_c0_g1_i2.p1 TRINITY_DN8691_c0_g1~~TRINITY_DN8691_c0_g1_i2.p1  ORF type:complete len:409 (+),score=24.52 TRINITY_DN8691_c0_g1_i2:58-1227(+)
MAWLVRALCFFTVWNVAIWIRILTIEQTLIPLLPRNHLADRRMQEVLIRHRETSNRQLQSSPRDYIACIPHHGLGNVFFAAAGCLHFAERVQKPVVLSYWQGPLAQLNTSPWQPWGGHRPPLGSRILPSHVFPFMSWRHGRNHLPANFSYLNVKAPNPRRAEDLERTLESARVEGATVIEGWFFTTQNYNVGLMRRAFGLHPALQQHYGNVFGHLFQTATTISVHLRLGYAGEESVKYLQARPSPPARYFGYALISAFVDLPPPVRFLVLSDNPQAARRLLTQQLRYTRNDLPAGFEVVVLEADLLESLHIMTKCDHHVLAASTFSFWGAYLAPKPGRVLYHTSMVQDLTRRIIPNNTANLQWMEVTDAFLKQWAADRTERLLNMAELA